MRSFRSLRSFGSLNLNHCGVAGGIYRKEKMAGPKKLDGAVSCSFNTFPIWKFGQRSIE